MTKHRIVIFLAFLWLTFYANAQTAGVEYGYEDQIKNSETISFKENFGETISPVLGSISWSFTDLVVPLSGPDIKIARKLQTSSFYPYSPNYFPSEIYDWSLDVPKIYLNFWGFQQSSLAACGIDYVKNIQITVPGVTGFDPVGRGQSSVTYPSNTAIYFANNWLLKCEAFSTRSQSVKSNGQSLTSKNSQFTLVSPDGEIYHFRYSNNRDFSSEVDYSQPETVWKINTFYVTDIQDRFGNWLTYDYKEVVLDSALDFQGEPRSTHLLLTKIRSSANVTVTLNNDNENITGFSYGGKTVSYIPQTTQWSGPPDYTTTLNGQTITILNSTTYLHQVSITDSQETFTWQFLHSEFGYQAPSGYYPNKGLTAILNPWGGRVDYTYSARIFGCSRNHIDLPLLDYSLSSRTYTDPVSSHTVTYNATRNWDPNYPNSYYPADDFAYTDVTYPDRIEHYEYHCARFQSYYLSDNKDHRLKRLIIKDLNGNTIQQTDYTWDEIPRSYLNSAFIWHDSNGANRLVADTETIDGNYVQAYLKYDDFGLLEKRSETNNAAGLQRYTKFEYFNDQPNWLIGFPQKTQVSFTDSGYTTTSQTTYHSSTIGSSAYANLGLPYRQYNFNSWQKEFTSYQSNGEVSRITFNQPLTYGSGNRYIIFQNYKRSIPQTIKTPQNLSDTEKTRYTTVDNLGRVTNVTDFEGHCTNYAYTALNWRKTITPCDSQWSATNLTYSLATQNDADTDFVEEGMLEERITVGSYRKETYYDGMLRPILIRVQDSSDPSTISYQRYSYDSEGNQIYSSFLSGGAETEFGIEFEYDELGRLTTKDDNTTPGNISFEYLTDDKVKVSDNKNNETTTTFRAFGSPAYDLPSLIQSPHSVNTTIVYNVFDSVTSISQGGLTEYRVYDGNNFLCKRIRKDVGNEAFYNNALGEVAWRAHGVSVNSSTTSCDTSVYNSEKTIFTRGNTGLVVLENYGDSSPDKTMSYNKNGLITSISAGGVVNSYDYNSANKLDTETLSIDSKVLTFHYDYDSRQNLTSNTYPNGEIVTYSPNALGQPTSASSYASNVTYYPNELLKQFTYGNGFIHNSIQYSNGLPKDFYDKKGTTIALDNYIEYDANGNLEYLRDDQNSLYNLDLGYDQLDRLVSVNDSYLGSGQINYDSMNNITYLKMGNHIIDYTYDGTTKRLSSTTGTYAYDFNYDNRGNVTYNGFSNFSYNLAQQVTQHTDSGVTTQYTYDGNNRRVKKTSAGNSTYFFYTQSGTLVYQTTENTDEINKIYLADRLIAENSVSLIQATEITSLNIDGTSYDLYSSHQSSIAFIQNLDHGNSETMSWEAPQNTETTIRFQYKIDFGTSGNSAGNPDVNWTQYGSYTNGTSSTNLHYDVGPITEDNVPSGYSSTGSDYAKLHIRVRAENSAGNSEWRYLKPIWVYFND